MESTWLRFGVLRRPHGTKGEILLAPYNPDGDRKWVGALPIPARWVKDDRVLDAAILVSRRVPAGFLVRFEGVNTRAAVAGLVGGEVCLPRQHLAGLGEQEFYVDDVVGCEAYLEDGRRLGRVAGTFWNGAHDVMSIVADDGGEQFLPVLPGFVVGFDGGARRLTVDLHE
jgi:16S rRNA processing protein RimM